MHPQELAKVKYTNKKCPFLAKNGPQKQNLFIKIMFFGPYSLPGIPGDYLPPLGQSYLPICCLSRSKYVSELIFRLASYQNS